MMIVNKCIMMMISMLHSASNEKKGYNHTVYAR